MDQPTKQQRVARVIADHLCIPLGSVTADKTLEELGADSLDHVELVIGLEDEFNLLDGIPDEKAAAMKTVGDAFAVVEELAK